MKLFDSKRFSCVDADDGIYCADTQGLIFDKVIPVLYRSLIAGLAAGFVVGIFDYFIDRVTTLSQEMYAFFSENKMLLPLFALFLIATSLLMSILVGKVSEAKGSGIPRCELAARGEKDLKGRRLLFGTLSGTTISFFAGLSVGMEGPSVQLGAGVGVGAASRLRTPLRKYVITSGIAAGFATAFGTPLAAIFFTFEDVTKRRDALSVAAVCMSLLGAAVTSSLLSLATGDSLALIPPLNLPSLGAEYYPYVVALAVLAGLSGVIFSRCIVFLHTSERSGILPRRVLFAAVFLLSGITGVLVRPSGVSTSGSGLNVINMFILGGSPQIAWQETLILLAFKTVLILIAFRSGATGGMMVPMLTLGSLLGAGIGYASMSAGICDSIAIFALLGMTTFFGSSISAPLTALALTFEFGGASALPPALLAVAISFIILKVLRVEPLYDHLIVKSQAMNSV